MDCDRKRPKRSTALWKTGVLSPVPHSDWAASVLPVLKKKGSVRLCGVFKLTLNKACPTEQYSLPLIEDIFASLSGGDCFSTPDLREAYNQISLDEESRKLTVLNTHKGLFCYTDFCMAWHQHLRSFRGVWKHFYKASKGPGVSRWSTGCRK